ncbi:MAG TPA: tetratricopeptide repeat protein [Anaerolineales bacterium]|nr:tetratricopeptide repeat protein [Anaerolineales bacterium]
MRERLRTGLILLVIFLAVSVPFISSGYSEITEAESASTHLQAAEHYKAAAIRLPWRPDLYELAGHHLYYAEEYAQADAAYQKAFNGRTLSPDGWVAWGDVVYLNGDPEHAAELWVQGLEQPNPSEKLYSRLAQTYQENKDYSKAAQYLQLYVQDHADDASAHYRLGLLLTLSDPNKALTELIRASQLDPQFDPPTQTLRTALNLSALSETPSQEKVVIGRGLGLVNEWKFAHVAFEEAIKLDENNAEAWAWLAEVNQQSGNDEALTYLDRALSLDPNSSVVRGLRGLYFQRVGNHRQALIEYQVAARLEPENPAWFISIGEEFSKLGDLILALEAYQYTTVLMPDDAEYWQLLAGFCAQNNINVRDVGVPAAQKAVTLAPDDPLALDMLGWLLVLDGRYFEAETKLTEALAIDPQLASAHFHLGLLYLQTDDRQSMFDHLVQARDLGSAEAEALLNQYFP